MANTVVFSKTVSQILKGSSTKQKSSAGPTLLIGRLGGNDVNVTACVRCSGLQSDKIGESLDKAKLYLPEGDDVVGLSILSPKADDRESLVKECLDAMEVLLIYQPFVACLVEGVSGIEILEVWRTTDDNDLQKMDFTVSEESILMNSIVGRTVFDIPLSFTLDSKGLWESSLHAEIGKISEEVISGSMLFHLDHSKVLLGSDSCFGIDDNVHCDSLFKYIEEDEEDIRTSKKSLKKSLRCLNFTGYTDMSVDHPIESIPSCSPIISYKTETIKKVSLLLGIDVITLIDPDTPVKDVASSICKSVSNQMQAVETCIRQFSKNEMFVTPVVRHYQPFNLQTLVSVLYPHDVADEQLEGYRRQVHQALCLPEDRPLFRRSNQFVFPNTDVSQGYLVNIHEGLSGSKGGTQSLVSGFYTYHHYMQDRFDDNKWGCAYRSLQTLVSWFNLQGYTDKHVPSHKEIQQILVDIGDKQPKFVGSRQWIGSMEVSFVLDTLLGVSCKILSVSFGAEMASKGRELLSHFDTQGTPVMIGGGVLAHTILGVDYNEVTGDIGFLILDPHYTGSEDKKVILDKGWCGWKGPDFWDQHAHYNMCLPQRPSVI